MTVTRCDRCKTEVDPQKVATALLEFRDDHPNIEQDLCPDCAEVVCAFLQEHE